LLIPPLAEMHGRGPLLIGANSHCKPLVGLAILNQGKFEPLRKHALMDSLTVLLTVVNVPTR
jgi:hypothetical protein